ncbi:malonate transporter subunit MadL [Paenibacillus sp. Soil787]|uniref:malonate transporter subunit MadL n=1 Tax=Paenibacillus sp. Soil787 TaxID=1736411 RepID=UPI0006F3F4C9|nr:malonate transporter subunit MadL [Paenibacillus sp. Soil787]KRF43613.1 malonate transporter [Paenibacillus sp. Soil787]
MVIYGVALLSISTLVGVFVGELLGKLLGVNANIGGVGIAILLLLLITDYLKKKNKLTLTSQEGLKFWSGMYIPIVVAMAAQQNVLAALKGGPVAILAAISAVAFSYALVPIMSKESRQKADIEKKLKNELHV